MAKMTPEDFGLIKEDATVHHEPSSRSFLENAPTFHGDKILGDIAYGLAKTGRGVSNALLPKALENKSPVENIFPRGEGLGHELIQGAAGFAPAMALAPEIGIAEGAGMLPRLGAYLAENAIPGAAYGAAQAGAEGNPILPEAGASAAINVGAGAIPGMMKEMYTGIKNALSRYSGKGLKSAIEGNLKGLNQLSNEDAYGLASSEHEAKKELENKAWGNVENLAGEIDKKSPELSPGYKQPSFDNTQYKKEISSKLDELKKQSREQSGHKLANQDAEKILNDILHDKHDTFSDAIRHNQALNRYYEHEVTPGRSKPLEAINFAKGALRRAMGENIEKNGLQDSLGKAWNDANKLTQEKNQIFHEVVSPKGKESFSTFKLLQSQKNPSKNVGDFVKDYLPSSSSTGTGKMEQLGKMLGDQQAAKDLIKANYFGKSVEGQEIDPNTFLSKYRSLSDPQKEHLFSPDQRTTIEALRSVLKKYPDALKTPALNDITKHSLLALMGMVGGHVTGIGAPYGALGAVAGQQLLHHGLSKALENPRASNWMLQHLTKGALKENPQLQEALRRLSQMAITPSATQALGGQ